MGLEKPDGTVTFVDYEARELTVNLNKGMGARAGFRFMIFDASSLGIATEKPKGTIELTSVGGFSSRARILETENPVDPIRAGDIVYSPVWSPNRPAEFALVGKMDVDRDGKDDREEVKRMIENSGGVIDFDLPPADLGKETGALSPRTDWYVVDDRPPLRESGVKPKRVLAEEAEFHARLGPVIKGARLHGTRPMTLGKLLAYLGQNVNKQARAEPDQAKAQQAPHRAGGARRA